MKKLDTIYEEDEHESDLIEYDYAMNTVKKLSNFIIDKFDMDDYDFENSVVNFRSSIKENKPVMAYQHLKEVISKHQLLYTDDLNHMMEILYYSKLNQKVLEIYKLFNYFRTEKTTKTFMLAIKSSLSIKNVELAEQ